MMGKLSVELATQHSLVIAGWPTRGTNSITWWCMRQARESIE